MHDRTLASFVLLTIELLHVVDVLLSDQDHSRLVHAVLVDLDALAAEDDALRLVILKQLPGEHSSQRTLTLLSDHVLVVDLQHLPNERMMVETKRVESGQVQCCLHL